MNNPLYNELGGLNQNSDFLARFNRFRSTFRGNPHEQVQQLLNSGRITQQQYNDAVRMAQQFQRMFIGR